MARKAGSLCRFSCCVCGAVELVPGGSQHFRCMDCRAAARYRPTATFGPWSLGMWEAGCRVRAEVRAGFLPHPRSLRCVDCAAPATEYDHRDYNAPLAVEPVCHPCNLRRGPGIPRRGAIEASLARGRVPYHRRWAAEKVLRAMGLPTDALADMPAKLDIEHWRALWPAATQEAA